MSKMAPFLWEANIFHFFSSYLLKMTSIIESYGVMGQANYSWITHVTRHFLDFRSHWLLVTDCHVFIENWTIAINLWSLQLDRSVFGKFDYLSYFSVFGRNVECRIRCLVSVINLEQLVCILRFLNVFIGILLENPFHCDYFQSY